MSDTPKGRQLTLTPRSRPWLRVCIIALPSAIFLERPSRICVAHGDENYNFSFKEDLQLSSKELEAKLEVRDINASVRIAVSYLVRGQDNDISLPPEVSWCSNLGEIGSQLMLCS